MKLASWVDVPSENPIEQLKIAGVLPWTSRAWIAGGWAACPALASDIDVWVHDPYHNLSQAKTTLLEHLEHAQYEINVEPSRERDFLHDADGYEQGSTLKVGVVDFSVIKPVHLMVTTGGPADVLAAFDISTHQIAILDNGTVYRGGEWTPLDQMPKILRMTPNTRARYEKIVGRYAAVREHYVQA